VLHFSKDQNKNLKKVGGLPWKSWIRLIYKIRVFLLLELIYITEDYLFSDFGTSRIKNVLIVSPFALYLGLCHLFWNFDKKIKIIFRIPMFLPGLGILKGYTRTRTRLAERRFRFRVWPAPDQFLMPGLVNRSGMRTHPTLVEI
jgi:hypothetical protein